MCYKLGFLFQEFVPVFGLPTAPKYIIYRKAKVGVGVRVKVRVRARTSANARARVRVKVPCGGVPSDLSSPQNL